MLLIPSWLRPLRDRLTGHARRLPIRHQSMRTRLAIEMLEDRAVPAGWALNVGSSVMGIATDDTGNVYTSGYFVGTVDLDPGAGVTPLQSKGARDAFVAKYDANGALIWARRMGGADGNDYGYDIAVSGDRVFVGGYFVGPADFGSTSLSSGYGYVTALNADGDFLWAKSFGNYVFNVATDSAGNAVATGRFIGSTVFDHGDATTERTAAGYSDAFVVKLAADGEFQWVRVAGSSVDTSGNFDTSYNVDIDALDNVYFSGKVGGSATFGTTQVNGVYVSKLDSNGNFVWTISRSDLDSGRGGLDVDDRDSDPTNWSVYLADRTVVSAAPNGISVSKFSASNGSTLWHKVMASPGYGIHGNQDSEAPESYALAVAPNGNVYVTGQFSWTTKDFDPGPGTAFIANDNATPFLLTLDEQGNYVAARELGGHHYNSSYALAVPESGHAYIGGYFGANTTSVDATYSGSAPFDVGSHDVTLDTANGGGFLVRYDLSYGAISGRVIHDANGNGLDDEGFGLQGRTVYLDQNSNGQLDNGEPTSLTNHAGVYLFSHLPAGSHTVAQVPIAGWTSQGPATISLTEGRVHNHTFANATATTTRTYTGTNLPAALGAYGWAESYITIPDNYNILDLNVRVSVALNQVQGFYINLISPSGSFVNLTYHYGTGISGNNLTNTVFDLDAPLRIRDGTAPYTGNFRPDSSADNSFINPSQRSLAQWDGKFSGGNWKLQVKNGSNKVGTLTDFALLVTTTSGAPEGPGNVNASINDVAITEGHSGTKQAAFTVSLAQPSTIPVSVNFATANGSAGSTDYVPASGTVTFAPGETSKPVSVAVTGDRLGEADESFLVNLSSPVGVTIVDGQGIATITDDEPRISISDVAMTEGGKNATKFFIFTVTLSAAYDQAVTMSYQTVNGTAKTSNNDYVAKTGTLTFAPGETTKTITITVKGDNNAESNETFFLDLFGASTNALFTKNRGIGTILNDD